MRTYRFRFAASWFVPLVAFGSNRRRGVDDSPELDRGADGVLPRAGLVADAQGNLYGTTMQGGTASAGMGRIGVHSTALVFADLKAVRTKREEPLPENEPAFA